MAVSKSRRCRYKFRIWPASRILSRPAHSHIASGPQTASHDTYPGTHTRQNIPHSAITGASRISHAQSDSIPHTPSAPRILRPRVMMLCTASLVGRVIFTSGVTSEAVMVNPDVVRVKKNGYCSWHRGMREDPNVWTIQLHVVPGHLQTTTRGVVAGRGVVASRSFVTGEDVVAFRGALETIVVYIDGQ